MTTMTTIWKDIKGYEGQYQVSNTGLVKSLQQKSERILKTGLDKGYERLTLTSNGVQSRKAVHRLVAMAFVENERPTEFNTINHIDGDTTNNNADNLEWCNVRGNTNHARLSKGSSKYPGVCITKAGTWLSRCVKDGKRYTLGSYKVEEDAYNAYLRFCEENGLTWQTPSMAS